MTQLLGAKPSTGPIGETRGVRASAARRWAWTLGFSLPLSGGLSLSSWVPGYPDQLTFVRIVTFASLAWISLNPRPGPLPVASRRMVQVFVAVLGYTLISLVWTPDRAHGIDSLISIALAVSSGVSVLLLFRTDVMAPASFAAGALVAFGLQVAIAIFEVQTGFHLTQRFGATYLKQWGITNVEAVFGSIAWGTVGNPNDLGGYFLLSMTLFVSARAYGLVLTRAQKLSMWMTVFGALAVGLTSLADARSFRLGVAIVVALHILDRALPAGGSLRASSVMIVLACGVAGYARWASGGSGISALITASENGDRLTLISSGLSESLRTGGLGLGVGAQKALIDSRQLPTNFHNAAVELAAELGVVVGGLFLVYLVWLLVSWALVHAVRTRGRAQAHAGPSDVGGFAPRLRVHLKRGSGVPVLLGILRLDGGVRQQQSVRGRRPQRTREAVGLCPQELRAEPL